MEDSDIVRSKDPKLVAARVYVANWPSDKSRLELAEYFNKYGTVLGTFIHEKGYAFVQFAEGRCALDAIARETHSQAFGRRLDIRLAKDGGGLKDGSQPMNRNPPTPAVASLPSLLSQYTQPAPVSVNPPFSAGLRETLGLGLITQGLGGMANYSRRPDMDSVMSAGMSGMYADAQYMKPEMFARREIAPVRNVEPSPATPELGPPPPKKTDIGFERPFDAAVVLSTAKIRVYAEMVERRLMELNLTVDLIFCLDEDKESKVLESMAKRGILYVVHVQPQHETHKSVTVNILHGTPQEHRNIPLDDALVMLARDSNAYLSNLRQGSELPSISFLTHLLSDGKNLSRAELDRIIDHLQDRRDKIVRAEGVPKMDTAGPPMISGPMNNTNSVPVEEHKSTPKLELDNGNTSSQELQQKILSILGGVGGAKEMSNLVDSPSNQTNEPMSNNGSQNNGGFPSAIDKTLQNLLQNPESLRNLMASTQKSTPPVSEASVPHQNMPSHNPVPPSNQQWQNKAPLMSLPGNPGQMGSQPPVSTPNTVNMQKHVNNSQYGYSGPVNNTPSNIPQSNDTRQHGTSQNAYDYRSNAGQYQTESFRSGPPSGANYQNDSGQQYQNEDYHAEYQGNANAQYQNNYGASNYHANGIYQNVQNDMHSEDFRKRPLLGPNGDEGMTPAKYRQNNRP